MLMNLSHAYHHLNGMFIMDHIKLDLIVLNLHPCVYVHLYMYIYVLGLYGCEDYIQVIT